MQITNLSKRFKRKYALRGIDFALDNECTALLGPNGAGKTTLIKCIAGTLTPTEGVITASGDEKSSRVGYLPQGFTFLPNLTVREALSYLSHLSEIPQDNIEPEVLRVIDLANLQDFTDTRVKALSGGTLRRLGIAQALLGCPRLLLLDEPTAGLDIEERAKLKTVLAKIKEDNNILISTHLLEDIIGLCDRVLVLREGSLIYNGRLEALSSFAENRVLLSKDEKPKQAGGVVSGSSFAVGEVQYRFVMPEKSLENVAVPTVQDGYLALLHGLTE